MKKYLDISWSEFFFIIIIGTCFYAAILGAMSYQEKILLERLQAIERAQIRDAKIKEQQATIRAYEELLDQSACYTTQELKRCNKIPKK